MAGDGPTAEFGGRLRAARERRGVSLRQIANKTKISIGVLEGLERGDLSRLPGGIFGRAFVRSYAVEAGLDPDKTIEEFLDLSPHDAATPVRARADVLEDGEALESSRRVATTFIWLLLISIPVVGVLLYFAQRNASRSSNAGSPPAAESLRSAMKPSTETVPPPENTKTPPVVTATPAVVPATESAGTAADRLIVELSSTRECWVSAKVDGGQAVERLFAAGETRAFEIRGELVLKAGDAAAIDLKINGAPARPLGKAGEVVTVRLTLSNYKAYLP